VAGTLDHEQVAIARGIRSGFPVIVAVHSTVRGPALGGCRMRAYADWREGLDDALALSVAMTDKAALAGLRHGGGKTVVVTPASGVDPDVRAGAILDVADAVAALGGRYLTGPDIGTGPADMAVVHERTGYAFCRPTERGGSGDSAAATADGVVAALRAGIVHVFGRSSPAGLRVGVVGLGAVGERVARTLAGLGAELTVADIDPRKRVDGARPCDPQEILAADLDVLVPAAVGGLLTHAVVDGLRARLVVGPANNQLAADDVAAAMTARGIVWVPDVVASAGGIVHAVGAELEGLPDAELAARVAGIGDTTASVLTEAAERSITTLDAARARADALTKAVPA
jgi:glutamate dehydrogenase/leucine dehydrogenase